MHARHFQNISQIPIVHLQERGHGSWKLFLTILRNFTKTLNLIQLSCRSKFVPVDSQ